MPRILIVEDEQKMADSLVKGLSKAGYFTEVINDGLLARITDIQEYDLVILDWMLPGVSGVDLLHYWRMQKKFTPILMLTAKNQVYNKVQGLDFGANDYMDKYFDWQELLARIRALLRRDTEGKQEAGEIKFDAINQQFSEKDKIVHLTKTEYRILAYFFGHPGRIITKDILINSIWDTDSEPSSNVIERHIKEIRKKFNYDPIITINGIGYRLRLEQAL